GMSGPMEPTGGEWESCGRPPRVDVTAPGGKVRRRDGVGDESEPCRGAGLRSPAGRCRRGRGRAAAPVTPFYAAPRDRVKPPPPPPGGTGGRTARRARRRRRR